jgi:hypothetical protein
MEASPVMKFMLDMNIYSTGLKSDNLVFQLIITSHHINYSTTNETNGNNRNLDTIQTVITVSNLSVPVKAVT